MSVDKDDQKVTILLDNSEASKTLTFIEPDPVKTAVDESPSETEPTENSERKKNRIKAGLAGAGAAIVGAGIIAGVGASKAGSSDTPQSSSLPLGDAAAPAAIVEETTEAANRIAAEHTAAEAATHHSVLEGQVAHLQAEVETHHHRHDALLADVNSWQQTITEQQQQIQHYDDAHSALLTEMENAADQAGHLVGQLRDRHDQLQLRLNSLGESTAQNLQGFRGFLHEANLQLDEPQQFLTSGLAEAQHAVQQLEDQAAALSEASRQQFEALKSQQEQWQQQVVADREAHRAQLDGLRQQLSGFLDAGQQHHEIAQQQIQQWYQTIAGANQNLDSQTQQLMARFDDLEQQSQQRLQAFLAGFDRVTQDTLDALHAFEDATHRRLDEQGSQLESLFQVELAGKLKDASSELGKALEKLGHDGEQEISGIAGKLDHIASELHEASDHYNRTTTEINQIQF